MTTAAAVRTTTIDGTEYRLRPPTDDGYVDQEAWLDYDLVVEFWDDDDDAPPDDAELIRTYGIECTTNLIDADGTIVGFMCPSCEQPVLLQHTEHYRDGYRGCTAFGCDVVVACKDVLSGN